MERLYPLADGSTVEALAVVSGSGHSNEVLTSGMTREVYVAEAESQPWHFGSSEQDAAETSSEGLVFGDLVAQWHRERGITSSIEHMISCTAYLRIIGMGEQILPFIFARLRSEGDDPDHWFTALQAITGVNPVPREDFGHVGKMTEAWLAWAATRDDV